jgi:hypothetical protein
MLLPEFQRVEELYAQLYAQYSAGTMSPDQFRSAVEANMVQHEGAYWTIGADSGQWFRHDGREWRQTAPPVAPVAPRPPAAPVVQPPQMVTTSTPQPAAQAPTPRSRTALLVSGAAVLVIAIAGGAYYLGRSSDRTFEQFDSSGDLVGSTDNPLLERLARDGVPAALSQDWDALFPPELSDGTEREPGEVGRVQASLQRKSDRSEFDYQVMVFDGPDSAQQSYRETTTFDMSQWPQEERDLIQQGMIHPPGMTAMCLSAAGRVTTCHAVTGRSIVFTRFEGGEPSESATRLTRVLVDQVDAIERGR